MDSSVEVDSVFGGGFGEELFRSNITELRAHAAYDNLETPQSQVLYKLLKEKQDILNEQKSAIPAVTRNI